MALQPPFAPFPSLRFRNLLTNFLQLLNINPILSDTPGHDSILLTQMRRTRRGNRMLRAIAHEFHIRHRHVRGADVFARHHYVSDVRRVQAPKGNGVGLVVAFVPFPTSETEVVFWVLGALGGRRVRVWWRIMQTECTFVLNDAVVEWRVLADVYFVEDVIALVAFEFTRRGHEGDPVEGQVCVLLGLQRLHVGEGAVNGAQEVVPDVFAVAVWIEPVAVFPEMR